MARKYSEEFLTRLSHTDSQALGVKLARVCVQANLPGAYVAVALSTSRTTVYSWFRGQGIREGKRPIVETFIAVVESDFANGVLPAKNNAAAKEYIEGMLGVQL